MKTSKQDQVHALEMLHKYLKPGDTVYTVLRNVSSSGMSRQVDLYTFIEYDGKIEKIYLTGYAAKAMNIWSQNKKTNALVITGCGMDVGFEAVYNLGRVMFPNGFAVSGRGRNGDTSGHDNDGGYALNQAWI